MRNARPIVKISLLVIVVITMVVVATLLSSSNSSDSQVDVAGQLATDWPQLQYDSNRSGMNPNVSSAENTYAVLWRWHPTNPNVSMSGLVQPVISEGILCAGYYDGKMYCLDKDTGTLKWEFATGGPILHTAAINNGKVIFASQDRFVYAVNSTTGQLVWKFETGKGIRNAPCIANSRVYIGSADSKMYALDVNTGAKQWEYLADAPIYTTAACTTEGIYFGDESVTAYALNLNGTQRWKQRLAGQSMAGYWPAVSNNGTVFFRTQPLAGFHDVLGVGDGVVGATPDGKTPANVELEQTNIRNHLNQLSNRRFKTFWTLDTATGAEKYTAPILYTSGEGGIPVPPAINQSTGQAYVIWRTKYPTFFSIGVRCCVDLGIMNIATGTIAHFAGPKVGYLHIIGDENTTLTANANTVFASSRGTLSGVNLSVQTSHLVTNSVPENLEDYSNGGTGPYAFGGSWPDGSIQGGGGQGGVYITGSAMAGDKTYWVARYGLIVALR